MKRRNALWTLVGAGSIGIRAGLNGGKAGLIGAAAPAIITAESLRPKMPCGAMVGDPVSEAAGNSVVIWSRTDRLAGMEVEYSTRADLQGAVRVKGPAAGAGAMAVAETGFTARVELRGLQAGAEYFYRVTFAQGTARSEPFAGRFRVPGGAVEGKPRGVRLLWSGDTCGQGWGINPDWGGMRIYEAMRQREPDFFIHSGDTIYADGVIEREVRLKDGSIWRNVVTEAKSRVARTLEDFRGAHAYNFLDANLRRFHAEVPQVWQWDDHEFKNNWSPGNVEGSAPARQAFREFAPMRMRAGVDRIYRKVSYGPLLDVFVVDMRSYRAANSWNRQGDPSPETVFLGQTQLKWLGQGLAASRAKWKVVAADMPLGLLVGDGKDAEGRARWEAVANGDGPALGRELEVARLLGGMKKSGVKNVVWVTADVHYTAAHRYAPERAQFTGFDPFWEFVSGPMNAGTFGPGALDNTFGPEVVFAKAPPKGEANLPPSAGYQFFGELEVDGRSGEMKVVLRDLEGVGLWERVLG